MNKKSKTLLEIEKKFKENSIYVSDDMLLEKPTVIGYEKVFKLLLLATQLNTFIGVSDFGKEEITVELIEKHMDELQEYAKKHTTGWPHGLQSGLTAISVLASSNITDEAKDYCLKLRAPKKFAAFTIPIVIDTSEEKTYYFKYKPIWGRLYYGHFRRLIRKYLVK